MGLCTGLRYREEVEGDGGRKYDGFKPNEKLFPPRVHIALKSSHYIEAKVPYLECYT